MIALLFLLILLVLSSVKALSFLFTYSRLRINGLESFGKVIAYEASRHVMFANALIPKIELYTLQNETIIGKPITSWFVEIDFKRLNEEVTLFQDKTNPKKFVIKGNAEPVANALVIILTVGYLSWFFTKLL